MTDLHIVEMFHTYQGEGLHAGRRALFVRLPFCNLKCSWCDTEFNKYRKVTAGEFREYAIQESNRFAVITGGEPLLNKHTPRVIDILRQEGFMIACETNGTAPYVPGIEFVTCSPKRFADVPYFVHRDLWDHVSEFKYVVDREFDFSVLARHDPGARSHVRHSLSPEFTEFKTNLERISEFVRANPLWRISLQTHKWANWP